MKYANSIILKPIRYTRETILDERKYRFYRIVLGRDKYQYMIGVKCTKKDCIHPKSTKGYTVHWKKFFTELPPASEYGGAYGLAKAYFDNPDGLSEEFGKLRLGCWENRSFGPPDILLDSTFL